MHREEGEEMATFEIRETTRPLAREKLKGRLDPDTATRMIGMAIGRSLASRRAGWGGPMRWGAWCVRSAWTPAA
jgi:hypothetical protein